MKHKPKKSLGQNFLKSILVINTISKIAEIKNTDTIIEIGPGKGILTKKLLENSKKVITIEKDSELINFLEDKFKKEIKNKKLELLNEDILDYKIPNIKYKLVANIPYNITGAIFKKFLTEENKPELMVLLVQKEVADRIIARDKKESILSLSVKVFGEPKYIMKVDKKLFSPQPKVNSAVIEIKNISITNFKNQEEEKKFFELIKTGFSHKRKILIKNLEKIYSREQLEKIFDDLKISKNSRAENLSLSDWLKIQKSLI